MIKRIILLFLGWKIFLFLPLIVSEIFLSPRIGYGYALLTYFLEKGSVLSNFLLYPWANFDGVYYLAIAGRGYTVDNAGFFPLFPILINFFSFNSSAFTLQQFLTGMVLSSIFFLLSLIVIYKLIRLDFKNNVGILVILAILVFPTSFFFAAIYSESLFLLLLVSSFYFARKGNWLMSSVCAALLTATRFVGIAVIPALIFEFYLQNKTILSKKIFSLFIIPFGLVSYSLFNFFEWGRPFQFIFAQGALHNNRTVDSIILFPQTIFRYFKILTTISINYEWWIALLELSTFIFASVMLYITWKKKVRISYLIFSLIAFLIPTSTGTFTGLPRYSLVLFPIFIALALIKNKWIKITYSIIGIILLFILFMLFSKGYYIS